jgi:hypothetical protein
MHGMTREGNAWHEKARHAKARHGMAWHGKARQCIASQGNSKHGMERHAKERHGMTSQDKTWNGKAIHLDTFYYIYVIIFNPLGLDVLNFFFGRIDIWKISS